jgi:hypothetical protein
MERGFVKTKGLYGSESFPLLPHIVFLIPGTPTSWNPVKAFQ